ncbi:hypothetical protein QQ045_026406 [Rhodiola kirilowii]
MEYLSRLLKGLSKKEGFLHHPKCHRVNLKHIMLADDLFLFCNGRISSISALKDCLQKFFMCSGLDININKSQIFVAGMDGIKRQWELLTKICPLPIKYLGISLDSKDLRAHDCKIVLEKLTERLNSWSNRFIDV